MKSKKYKGGFIDHTFLQNYDVNIKKINTAIRTLSGKHSIDPEIADRFIHEQLSPVRRQAAKNLVENTIYITLEEVSLIVEELIVKLYTENDFQTNIYFYCGTPKKSFFFMSVLALFYIRKHNNKINL